MNVLFRHIEFLLTRHDCVIVPGLGAFIVTSAPAVIDRASRRVSPPSRSVMFNQAVTLDDGLLANSYARRLKLSFEEARQVVLKDVAELLEKLHIEKKYTAGNIGLLSLGDDEQLIFTPNPSSCFNTDETGFYTIAFSKFSSQENTKVLPDAIVEDPKVVSTPEKQYFHFRINRSVIRFTAAFAVLVALTLAVIMYPVPRDKRELRASVMPVEALIPATPHQQFSEPKIKDTLQSAPVPTQLSEPIQTNETPKPEYFLIVATFRSKHEADRYVSIHSSNEFPLETVSSRKVTRVYAAASSDKKELLPQLNSSKIAQKFPNAWIWSAND